MALTDSYNTDQQPVLSIITVVRNAAKLLPQLISNISTYKTPQIEFIIIDGASTDNTVEIIAQNASVIDQWVSEPDKGIYDAMNKSVKIARGKWLYFIGADDFLKEGFAQMVPFLKDENTIYYGGVIFNGKPYSKPYSTYKITKENVCHQAIFYPRTVFSKYLYDSRYPVFADYHLNVRCWTDTEFKKEFHDLIVAHFTEGGYSHTTPDPLYYQEKHEWFKQCLNTKDYLRYLNRMLGTGKLAKALLSGSGRKQHFYQRHLTGKIEKQPGKKTILIIEDNLPAYDKSSGAQRLFELIKLFTSLNLQVIYLPDDGQLTEPYYTELQSMGVISILHRPNRKAMLRQLKNSLSIIDYAWISRPSLNKKYRPVICKNKNIRLIFDTVDLHYIRMLRQAEQQQDEKLRKGALKTKLQELDIARKSDATITVTHTEKNILEEQGIRNVYVIPNIHTPKIVQPVLSFGERQGILFIGGYKHQPNVDAALWLVQEIMPLVWQHQKNIPLYLLGSYPPPEVNALASEQVFVPGYLPNVSSYFKESRVFVAPLRYGAGMKGKIGQGLEYGLPTVSTTIGAEGMNLIHDQNVLIADDVKDFADAIIRLYNDEPLWNTIHAATGEAISAYSPEKVKQQLEQLFEDLAK
ncbi:glycosyltransferase (plasmid) [Pedobacter sp. BS3]|uniref:glycosyltransferase n=1 Tax=Pedobacter sp. BS3 TaxID=2567937 RepID=UPI0011EE0693|nr:glycosyltransferase [Pedobacter sp. BS3]TZF86015.1 glycosyltransferase [Pedobacter sp. BS3]